MADDFKDFIQELKLIKPILYGFSDGGIIGIILAYKYPDLLSSMIISGANLTPDGLTEESINYFKTKYEETNDQKFEIPVTQPTIVV